MASFSSLLVLWVSLFFISFLSIFSPHSSSSSSSSSSLSLAFSSHQVTLLGDASFKNGAISLTQNPPPISSSSSSSGVGRALYSYPIRFLDPNSNSTASFISRFSFSIIPSSSSSSFGDGLTFLITSNSHSLGSSYGYIGLPNRTTTTPHEEEVEVEEEESFVAVEFDTHYDPYLEDISDNHIGVDINSIVSVSSVDASTNGGGGGGGGGFDLKGRKPMTAWIEYRDSKKMIRVWISNSETRPMSPILAAKIDLSMQFKEFMHVGFSASNGNGVSAAAAVVLHLVEKWRFKTFGFVVVPSSSSSSSSSSSGGVVDNNNNPTSTEGEEEGGGGNNCFMCSDDLDDSPPNESFDLNSKRNYYNNRGGGGGGGGGGGELALGIGGGAAFVVSVIVLIGGFSWYLMMKKKAKIDDDDIQSEEEEEDDDGQTCRNEVKQEHQICRSTTTQVMKQDPVLLPLPTRLSLDEIKLATRGFHPSRIIGDGGSGTVYEGFLSSGKKVVAIKRFSRIHQVDDPFSDYQFTNELAAMVGSLKHRNLLHLQGWCCEADELVLVYEYLPHGSLDKYLHKTNSGSPPETLLWEHRLKIVLGVASALAYLHEECERQIIHRDVKACNIMLDSDFNAKLGDFGLAELYERNCTTREATIAVGTMGYLAPEYVHSGIPTEKTDVYSFGVVILEVATGRRPVNNKGVVLVDWVWRMWTRGKLMDAVDFRLMGRFDRNSMGVMLVVGLSCVHPNCMERPSVKEAARMLRGEAPLPILPTRKPVLRLQSHLPEGTEEILLQRDGDRNNTGFQCTPWCTPQSRFISEVWWRFIQSFGVCWAVPSSIVFVQWRREALPARGKIFWDLLPNAILWCIWEERNRRCFNGVANDTMPVVMAVRGSIGYWCSVLPEFRGLELQNFLFQFDRLIRT